jgi:hypothetical protein
LTEVGYVAYDRYYQPIEVYVNPDPTNTNWGRPYWAHWVQAVGNAASGHVDASRQLHDWLQKHRAFEDVVHEEFWLPIIPGKYNRPPAEAEFLKHHSRALEEDVLVCFSTLQNSAPKF